MSDADWFIQRALRALVLPPPSPPWTIIHVTDGLHVELPDADAPKDTMEEGLGAGRTSLSDLSLYSTLIIPQAVFTKGLD